MRVPQAKDPYKLQQADTNSIQATKDVKDVDELEFTTGANELTLPESTKQEKAQNEQSNEQWEEFSFAGQADTKSENNQNP